MPDERTSTCSTRRSTQAERATPPRRHRRSSARSATLGLVAVIALAGCSSSDHSSSATTSTDMVQSTSTTKPTSTTAATAKARASDGCGKTPAVTGLAQDRPYDVPLTFQSGSSTRAYRLAIPDTYDRSKPAPLVLALHGSGSNALQQSVYADIPRTAARRGYITVTPDATDGVWEFNPDGADDDFIDGLLTAVERDYCVDLNRVNAAGISLGAWKASLVACKHADRYAALALVAEEVRPDTCPPMPVIAFHGTADHTVPYGDGADPGVTVTGPNAGLPGARHNLDQWAAAAGCSTDKAVTALGTDVERWSYLACDPGLAVDFYTVQGGDHTWPGSDIDLAATTSTIDATVLALDFFDAHPLR